MTLDMECDSKDMDQRTADLVETASEVFALVASYMPNLPNPDSLEHSELVTECQVKALLITQIITGESEQDANEALNHAIERDNCIDQLEKQLKEKREND